MTSNQKAAQVKSPLLMFNETLNSQTMAHHHSSARSAPSIKRINNNTVHCYCGNTTARKTLQHLYTEVSWQTAAAWSRDGQTSRWRCGRSAVKHTLPSSLQAKSRCLFALPLLYPWACTCIHTRASTHTHTHRKPKSVQWGRRGLFAGYISLQRWWMEDIKPISAGHLETKWTQTA